MCIVRDCCRKLLIRNRDHYTVWYIISLQWWVFRQWRDGRWYCHHYPACWGAGRCWESLSSTWQLHTGCSSLPGVKQSHHVRFSSLLIGDWQRGPHRWCWHALSWPPSGEVFDHHCPVRKWGLGPTSEVPLWFQGDLCCKLGAREYILENPSSMKSLVFPLLSP